MAGNMRVRGIADDMPGCLLRLECFEIDHGAEESERNCR